MARSPEQQIGIAATRTSRVDTKADTTTTVSRSIVNAEVKARDDKTAKLRALRLAQEAVAEPAPAKPKRKAPAKKK